MSLHDPHREDPLDWRLKGLPDAIVSHEALKRAHIQLFDDQLMLPCAILQERALRHNLAWMQAFADHADLLLAPHGKTTMAPELLRSQLQQGAWAITAATAHHVRAYRRFGAKRILLANQLVGKGNIEWVVRELANDPEFEFYALVDSIAGATQLADAVAAIRPSRPLKLLIEVGRIHARAGTRSLAEGIALVEAVKAHAPHLSLAGVETFEGVVAGPNAAEDATGMLELMVETARAVDEAADPAIQLLISAGGSAYFDLVAPALTSLPKPRWRGVLRSGCYVSLDHGLYHRAMSAIRARSPTIESLGAPPQPALQVWGHIQSVPEPGRVICTIGRRDVGEDADLPTPILSARPGAALPRPLDGFATLKLFDQHAVVAAPQFHDLAVGDLIGFGVSHPCTTFDKWKALFVVDDDWRVTDIVRTYF